MNYKNLIVLSSMIFGTVLCETIKSYPDENSDWPELPQNLNNSGLSNKECVNRIYRQCNYPQTFTNEELENVRQFFNYSFTVLADIKPDKPLCPKLHVRHDWKCTTQHQRNRIIKVWKQMYNSGIIQRLTDLHVKTWPAWHKSGELVAAHRWFTNQFEKAMRSIDPSTFLPYIEPTIYGVQPERASIWDTLGHSGNYANGYTVEDGIYAQMDLVPTIKRHWTPRCTINPWDTPEYQTMYIQTSENYDDLGLRTVMNHFVIHLNIGGYEGQQSIRTAPYDVFFFMHHVAQMDIIFFRWCLLNQKFLVPLDYSSGFRYNPINGNLEKANIKTDFLTGVPKVTIRENFWLGFGDLCYVPDQLIKPINNLWKGRTDPVPTAARRLPKWILEKYFPKFVDGNFTGIAHVLEEVGDCNKKCVPIPKPTFLEETENGRRQMEAFCYDNGHDECARFKESEKIVYNFWLDLNRSGYCSPYVTTY